MELGCREASGAQGDHVACADIRHVERDVGERLPITDGAWLAIEGRATPMHVAGLQLFRYPDGAPPTFLADLYEHFRSPKEVVPPFSSKLDRPYGIAGQFAWVDDPDVDLDYHVRHSALPAPGRVRELFVLISRLHSTLLDRTRPLWETHLIEGLTDNRFAVYTKFHHSMFDGVGAMRAAQRMFSTDPDVRDLPAPWAVHPDDFASTADDGDPDDGEAASTLAQVGRLVSAQLSQAGSVVGVTRAFASQFAGKLRGVAGEVVPYEAPKCILNGRISGSRRFAADGFAFERIRAVGKAFGATVNDVVLAMCSSALRAYLGDLNKLPDRPLIAMIPVSIRTEGAGSRGNALSMLLCNLATDVADPVDRLAAVKASMDRGKARLQSMSREELVNYALALTAPTVFSNLVGTAGRGRPTHNVVISNVPGPREPMYFNGARMEGLYPVSLLPQGQALNITLTSYVDDMEFGITACRKTLPHVQRLLDYLTNAIEELEAAA